MPASNVLVTFEEFLEYQLRRMRMWRAPHVNAAEQLARRAFSCPPFIAPTGDDPHAYNVIEGDPDLT